MKIRVDITFEEFKKFSYSRQREFFLEFFTEKTILFFISESQRSGNILSWSKGNQYRNYSLSKIAPEIFDFKTPDNDYLSADIDVLTGVKLTNSTRIRHEWDNDSPFDSRLPEIEFIPNSENMPKGSFMWKIAIPDAIDLFYLPLRKKEMKTIQLIFQPVDVSID